MFNPTANTEEKLMLFANQLYMLSVKKSNSESGMFYSPKGTVKVSIPDIWLENNSFNDTYVKTRDMYFQYHGGSYDEKSIKKYYPLFSKREEFLYSIGSRGKPTMGHVFPKIRDYIYHGADISYTELNKVKDDIIAERSKLFKNKRKIRNLSEQHKQLRKSLVTPASNLPRSSLDKVFLKTFAYRSYSMTGDVGLDKDLFLCTVGWIKLPPFFFNDSLYDLKNKDYANYDVTCFINLMPEASLAIITKDLQADSGDTFFKKGVTEGDVLRELKKQAEYERKFAEKFNLEFACGILNERLKTFTPDPKRTKQELIVKLPYMGLDHLNDEQLSDVAGQIFRYYSLFEQYPKYESWYKRYPMTKFCNEYVKYAPTYTSGSSWEKEAAAILPYGSKDLPYLDHYLRALDSNRFHTYYDLCNYVKEIRENDELRQNVKKIAQSQDEIKKQNNAIIQNQNRLYAQNERHHKEVMQEVETSYRSIMRRLSDVQDSIDSLHNDIIIYY